MKNNGELGPDAFEVDGNVQMAVGQRNKKIVIQFQRPMSFIVIDPPNAVALANQFLDLAKACGFEVVLNLPKRKISKEQRDRLCTRATHVFRSLQEKNRPPAYIARHVVDTILSAID
jgi:hypothetical protein